MCVTIRHTGRSDLLNLPYVLPTCEEVFLVHNLFIYFVFMATINSIITKYCTPVAWDLTHWWGSFSCRPRWGTVHCWSCRWCRCTGGAPEERAASGWRSQRSSSSLFSYKPPALYYTIYKQSHKSCRSDILLRCFSLLFILFWRKATSAKSNTWLNVMHMVHPDMHQITYIC